MNERVKYGIEILAEDLKSELVIVISLLEALKERHPKVYDIAVKAIQETEEK